VEGNEHINADKLMIVAHPDDELIFGGRELLRNKNWKVVCVTNGSKKSGNIFSLSFKNVRKDEFISVMNTLSCAYEIWDYEDNGFNSNWDEVSLLKKLQNLINEKKYNMIVTHNLDGEYGHIQHKKISKLVHCLKPDNLHVFGYTEKMHQKNNANNCTNPDFYKLNEILTLYNSQKKIIQKYNTNILNQTIYKVNF
jgi:LmbE family N-acetylglucosaminyl deacetylase